jgi:iron complex outermembrane recepter protein
VNNLLNEDYYSITSQMINRNELYSKAQGRTVYLKLGVNY